MPAPFGSKNALKWTEEKAFELFEEAYTMFKEDKKHYSLESVACEMGRSKQTFYYLLDKFQNYEAIHNFKNMLDTAIVARVHNLAIEGTNNPAVSIFTLKQLGWKDQQHLDHTSKGESIIITQNFGGTDTE